MKKLLFVGLACLLNVVFLPVRVMAQVESVVEQNVSAHDIRVAVARGLLQLKVKVRGSYEMTVGSDSRPLKKGRRLPLTTVRATASGLTFGPGRQTCSRMSFSAPRSIVLIIDGEEKKFRSRVDLLWEEGQGVTVLNILNIEDYISGVLYHETSHRWPMEALKAQAVAARTYAYYRKVNSWGREFDVSNDIYSQVFGGRNSERYRTNLAVERTAGEILAWQGQVLPAYFHSCCGGHTEDVTELWNHAPLTPLGGAVCRYCSNAPHAGWKKNVRLKDIQDKLNRRGYQLGLIKDIRVKDRTRSGRVRQLEIVTRDGKRAEVSGKDFRQILGPNNLKSNLYEITMQGYYLDFHGRGWGHGVGLCQWGAREMARQRFDYRAILQYYYPAAELTPASEIAGVR